MSHFVFKCTKSTCLWRETRPQLNGGCLNKAGVHKRQKLCVMDGKVKLR